MPSRIKLSVVEGEMTGRQYVFDRHDMFLFGRSVTCRHSLPGDEYLSRHHFLLRTCPPDAWISDLGSRNGTFINGEKFGGRAVGETLEDAAKRDYPVISLKSGDLIKVGKTAISVSIELPPACCKCGAELPEENLGIGPQEGQGYLCDACKKLEGGVAEPAAAPAAVQCQNCGKDVSHEVDSAHQGDYICEECRNGDAKNLFDLVSDSGSHEGAAKWQVLRELGEGKFGRVFLVQWGHSPGLVAVKMLLSTKVVDEYVRKCFLREIEIMSNLRHDNIVPLYEHGSSGGAFYFVMEYCEGGSVRDLMIHRDGKLTLEEARPIVLDMVRGLAEIHRQGFVHRDIKPENILLKKAAPRATAKIADLGITKAFQDAGMSGVTRTGICVGTPQFLAPEQVADYIHVKPSADVYSLGATLYNMLTGAFAKDFPAHRHHVAVILEDQPVPIRQRESTIPRKLARVIDRALDNDPARRYKDGSELAAALSASYPS
jgi:hypothetical protein